MDDFSPHPRRQAPPQVAMQQRAPAAGVVRRIHIEKVPAAKRRPGFSVRAKALWIKFRSFCADRGQMPEAETECCTCGWMKTRSGVERVEGLGCPVHPPRQLGPIDDVSRSVGTLLE